MRSSRRSFLRALGAAVAAGPVGVLGCERPDPGIQDAARVLGTEYEQLDRLATIGQAFRSDYEDGETLARELAATIDMAADDTAALSAFDAQLAADFEATRVRPLRGWVLADTELAACALISLAS